MLPPHSYPRGTLSRSSTDAGKAYLQAAWKSRLNLTDHERLGFGQFFYVFLSSYLESRIFALIDFRLEAMRTFTQTASSDVAYRLGHTKPGDTAYFNSGCDDSKPAFFSLFKLIEEKDDNLQKAAIGELIKIYNSIFPTPVNVLLGDELWWDLQAIAAMRNLLAHGRVLSIEFEGANDNAKFHPDTSTLKQVADRLRQAKILPTEKTISRNNYHQWESAIFSDEALLYFYNRVLQIEVKLKSCSTSHRESELIARLPNLPELPNAF